MYTEKEFDRREGQSFKNIMEFERDNLLMILAKSVYTRRYNNRGFTGEDTGFFRMSQWHVFYGEKGMDINNFGVTRLKYPKSENAMQEKAALKMFMGMTNDSKFINFKFKK